MGAIAASSRLSKGRQSVLLAPRQLGIDRIADEFGTLLLADQRFDPLGHAFLQTDENRFNFERWASHRTSLIHIGFKVEQRQ